MEESHERNALISQVQNKILNQYVNSSSDKAGLFNKTRANMVNSSIAEIKEAVERCSEFYADILSDDSDDDNLEFSSGSERACEKLGKIIVTEYLKLRAHKEGQELVLELADIIAKVCNSDISALSIGNTLTKLGIDHLKKRNRETLKVAEAKISKLEIKSLSLEKDKLEFKEKLSSLESEVHSSKKKHEMELAFQKQTYESKIAEISNQLSSFKEELKIVKSEETLNNNPDFIRKCFEFDAISKSKLNLEKKLNDKKGKLKSLTAMKKVVEESKIEKDFNDYKLQKFQEENETLKEDINKLESSLVETNNKRNELSLDLAEVRKEYMAQLNKSQAFNLSLVTENAGLKTEHLKAQHRLELGKKDTELELVELKRKIDKHEGQLDNLEFKYQSALNDKKKLECKVEKLNSIKKAYRSGTDYASFFKLNKGN